MEKRKLNKDLKQTRDKNNQRLNEPIGKPNRKVNRFDAKTSTPTFPTHQSTIATAMVTTSKSPETKRQAAKNHRLKLEKEKQLFVDHPELFEKRMIVIDGSNVAYS